MTLTEDKKLASDYAKTICKWRKFTKDLRVNLYTRFEGAASSFETDDAHNSLSFVLFGRECSMKLSTNLYGYYLSYRFQMPNETYIRELMEGTGQLKFTSYMAGELQLSLDESNAGCYDDTFTNIFQIFIVKSKQYGADIKPSVHG